MEVRKCNIVGFYAFELNDQNNFHRAYTKINKFIFKLTYIKNVNHLLSHRFLGMFYDSHIICRKNFERGSILHNF